MTTEDVVRRLRAFEVGRPLPCGETLRVPRLPKEQILILAFVKMGGESAPWGIAFGRPGDPPQMLTTPEPRTRDDVAEMVSKLAPSLLTHVHHPRFSPFGPSPDANLPPFQVWVPNATHLDMLHHLNYAYTFTRFGAESRRLLLNQLGQACGWLFREAQRPGQMVTMVAAEVLSEAFAFPAETPRLAHPSFLLAWLKTKGGRNVRMEAASQAEQLSAATSLDPPFERDELAFYVELYNEGRREQDDSKLGRAIKQIDKLLREELERRFRVTEEAIDVLHGDKRRENSGLRVLQQASLDEHKRQFRRIEQDVDDREDGPAFRPSPETDRFPAAAASRFYVHEASQELRDTLLVHDDRELQADLIAAGEAIAGKIVEVRDEGEGRRTVPVWVIETTVDLPLRVREDSSLCVVGLRSREVRVRDIERIDSSGYGFTVVVTKLITVPRNGDGSVLPAVSARLKGRRVVLVKPSMDQIARLRSRRVWQRDVPGAWLTHAVPRILAAEMPEDVAEDLTRLSRGDS
jgi:hypothetical protein